MDCIFCAIARKEIPATIVYEDDLTIAFADINPAAPSHILVIPRRHYDCLAHAGDDEILAGLLTAAQAIARSLDLDDYRVVINNGPKAGQTVFHLHLHLLGGRDFSWPPG
jgi:histidine triad (HIT) family protein